MTRPITPRAGLDAGLCRCRTNATAFLFATAGEHRPASAPVGCNLSETPNAVAGAQVVPGLLEPSAITAGVALAGRPQNGVVRLSPARRRLRNIVFNLVNGG